MAHRTAATQHSPQGYMDEGHWPLMADLNKLELCPSEYHRPGEDKEGARLISPSRSLCRVTSQLAGVGESGPGDGRPRQQPEKARQGVHPRNVRKDHDRTGSQVAQLHLPPSSSLCVQGFVNSPHGQDLVYCCWLTTLEVTRREGEYNEKWGYETVQR